MTDIVERLRTLGTEWAKATGESGPGVASLQIKAADEIERLRAALAPLEAAMDDDWAYILSLPGDGGRGKFWKDILRGLRPLTTSQRDPKWSEK